MGSPELKNKPLVEAIVEIRWALKKKDNGMEDDPHYRLLLSRLYDRLQDAYPEHEQLEAAGIPDGMVGHIVQHRFRTAHDDWPLVQLGPGIMTVNDTHKYKWEDYRERVVEAKNKLYAAHPKPAELEIQNIVLRYIDAIALDSKTHSVFELLGNMLKVKVALPDNLFDDTSVDRLPQSFVWESSFHCTQPPGRIQLKFAIGKASDRPALVWETTIGAVRSDLPSMPDGFEQWLDDAHTLTGDWFFKLIAGDLQRSFMDG